MHVFLKNKTVKHLSVRSENISQCFVEYCYDADEYLGVITLFQLVFTSYWIFAVLGEEEMSLHHVRAGSKEIKYYVTRG